MPKALTYNVAVNSRTGSKRQVGKQKGQAQNAVASLAYGLGETLYDEQEQDRRKGRKSYKGKDEVTHREIVAPEGAPEWVFNPQELANHIERSETRKNSQLLRSHILALPNDLEHEAKVSIVRDFAQTFTDKGQVVAFALHEAPGNSHAHLYCTMRELDETGPEGFSKHKQRDWNDYQKPGKPKEGPNLTDDCRAWLEERVNQEMEKAGLHERIIYTSYEANGIDKEPTKHIGPTAGNLEKEGIESDRATENIRKVKQKNAVKDAVRGERSEAEYGDAAVDLDKRKPRQERTERKPREQQAEPGIRGERSEAEFGEAAIKLDKEAERQARQERQQSERNKHRDAVKQSRQGARQWERARIKDEAAPQHDANYHKARELQAKYLNKAWHSWRRSETGVTVAQNAETRAKLAARPEPEATAAEQSHVQAVGAAVRAGLSRAGQSAVVLINRIRDYIDRKPGAEAEPQRTPQGGRGSVYDALRQARGTDSNIETARDGQGEQERTRQYER